MRKLLLILTISILLSGLVNAFETPKEAINEYYGSFIDENINRYMDVQYLNQYSKEAIEDKKEYVLKLFDMYDTTKFELTNFNVIINNTYAYAEYTIATTIKGDESLAYTEKMSAILLYDDGWKVYQVVPTKILQANMQKDYAIALSNETYTEPLKIICEYPKKEFKNATEYSLEGYETLTKLIGNNKNVKVIIDNDEYYFSFKDGVIYKISKSDVDYTITTNSCTIQRIIEGADVQKEIDDKNIIVKGNTFGSGLKIGLGKFFFKLYKFFKPSPAEIWIEAESGKLSGPISYSFIGATSRGPGELYLGDKGATSTYDFKSEYTGEVFIYLRVSDDGVHNDGARSVTFNINGNTLTYNHKSVNYVKNGNYWGWEYLGKGYVKKGDNLVTITKPMQTSAAFTLDKFVLAEKELVLK